MKLYAIQSFYIVSVLYVQIAMKFQFNANLAMCRIQFILFKIFFLMS